MDGWFELFVYYFVVGYMKEVLILKKNVSRTGP